MDTMPRVVHFEISTENPQEIVSFYQSVFGWKIFNTGGPVDYRLITTGKEEEAGIDGAIKRTDEWSQPTVITVDVPSIDTALIRVKEAGGTILTQKASIPGIGYHAYVSDPEGVIIGILEQDESAA